MIGYKTYCYILCIYSRKSQIFPSVTVSLMDQKLFSTSIEVDPQALAAGFEWSLNDNKLPQVYGSFRSILVDLNSTDVSMISILPLIDNSSNHLRSVENCLMCNNCDCCHCLIFHSFILVHRQDPRICLFFVFVDFHKGKSSL